LLDVNDDDKMVCMDGKNVISCRVFENNIIINIILSLYIIYNSWNENGKHSRWCASISIWHSVMIFLKNVIIFGFRILPQERTL